MLQTGGGDCFTPVEGPVDSVKIRQRRCTRMCSVCLRVIRQRNPSRVEAIMSMTYGHPCSPLLTGETCGGIRWPRLRAIAAASVHILYTDHQKASLPCRSLPFACWCLARTSGSMPRPGSRLKPASETAEQAAPMEWCRLVQLSRRSPTAWSRAKFSDRATSTRTGALPHRCALPHPRGTVPSAV